MPEERGRFGVLSFRHLVFIGVPVAAAVFLLSAAVGYWATEAGKPYNWDVAAVFGTALGTVLLAAATGALAWKTSEDVRATWQLADLTRKDHENAERPILLVQGEPEFVPRDPNMRMRHEGAYLAVAYAIRNVGRGPALDIRIEGTWNVDGKPSDSVEILPVRIPSILAGTTESRYPLLPARIPSLPVEDRDHPSLHEWWNRAGPNARIHLRGTYTDRQGRPQPEFVWPRSTADQPRGDDGSTT